MAFEVRIPATPSGVIYLLCWHRAPTRMIRISNGGASTHRLGRREMGRDLRRELLVGMVLVFGLVGCGKFPFDPDQFDSSPRFSDLDLADLQPSARSPYWELRRGDESRFEVVGAGGSMSRDELSDEMIALLDAADAKQGFAHFIPAGGYHYIVYIEAGEVSVAASISELNTFLGTISTITEALLLVRAHDYDWWGDKETGAIRAVANGYEVVALKYIRFCPSQVDRVLLHVTSDGAVLKRASETRGTNGPCI